VHSIDNLCRIGNQGTIEMDKIILDIMLNKQDRAGKPSLIRVYLPADRRSSFP
jgi:hypothetical protein